MMPAILEQSTPADQQAVALIVKPSLHIVR
jgi:hypothetical protein